MNAARRKDLAQALELLGNAAGLIDQAASDERDYYDNMPESLQASEKGERASEVADALEEAAGTLVDLIATLEGVAS